MTASTKKPPRERKQKPVLGWREWVALPELGVPRVKAKVDTGARSSSLHAEDIEIVKKGHEAVVQFRVAVVRGDRHVHVSCESPLHDERWVTSSNGTRQRRPVLRTTLEVDGQRWPIDLTLTARDTMGFPMLLGREAVRKRFVVDPGRSFLMKALVPKKR